MLRSPTTHIVEIGTSTTKTTPTLLQKLNHANSYCSDQQQQQQQRQNEQYEQQKQKDHYLNNPLVIKQEHKRKSQYIQTIATLSNRSTSIGTTSTPTIITPSPSPSPSPSILSLKDNLITHNLLLFTPFAFMRSKKSKVTTTSSSSVSVKSEPQTRTIHNPVEIFTGYESKLPLTNLVDCKSFVANNNQNNNKKNRNCLKSNNSNNSTNNKNINKYNSNDCIYKTAGEKSSLQPNIITDIDHIVGDNNFIETQCSRIDNNNYINNKNNYNNDKSKNHYNKNYINCTNYKDISSKNCDTYNNKKNNALNTVTSTAKIKSFLSSKTSLAVKPSITPRVSESSSIDSTDISTSATSVTSVLSVLSYSAIVASPTTVTIAVLSPSIATRTTSSTISTIATTMSPTSQTPPSSRTSLFDSCHRKIRLISGGPVAFLGGLVAKARRKERDGDQNSTDTKLYLEESVLERKLPEADLKALVDLPAGLDYNEWLASHTLALFEHVNLVYGTISEFCTPSGCADMTGPGNRTYLWFDEKGKKTRVAAPQYIDYVMTFTQKTVSDESIFPTKHANEFPSSFESIARKILRLQFHVIAHLYATHFREIALLGLHTHLNLTFAHLTALHRRFNLIDEKETDVLRDLEIALRLTDDGNTPISQDNCNESASPAIITTKTITGNGISGEVNNKQNNMMEDVNSRAQCNNINESNQLSIPPICSQPEAKQKSHKQQQHQLGNTGLMGGILGDLSNNELNYCTSISSVPAATSSSTSNNSSSATTTCSVSHSTDTIGFTTEVAPLHNNFNYNNSKKNNNINNNNNNNHYHNYHQHNHNLVHHTHTHHHNHYTPNSGLIQCNATNAPNAANNTTSTTTA